MNEFALAKIAYDAYCKSTGGVSLISGDKLPEFDGLRDSIKEAWRAAAAAVLEDQIDPSDPSAQDDWNKARVEKDEKTGITRTYFDKE